MTDIVIIGAGQAGFSLASKLRDLAFEGTITLIGEETSLPYQRPPLSKKYLLGEMSKDQLLLKPEDFYDKNDINLITGQRVTAIDPQAKTIKLKDKSLNYDHLALTTGSKPLAFPYKSGGGLDGLHLVRTLEDIDGLMGDVEADKKVLIIGGGYIGLEAAAVAAMKGLQVHVVEMAERILQRVACEETSDFFRQLHQEHDVEILEGVGVERLEGERRVERAFLSNGQVLDIDFVIVGIGIRPDSELAEAAGLEIENGIKVNEFGQTSNPSIWAAGDCASFPFKDGARIRLESVPHASAHGECVAQNMMAALKGEAMTAYLAKPWFWSDQYDLKLQIAGLNAGYTRVEVREGSRPGGQSHWYFKGDELLAVDAMNDAKAYMLGKREIEGKV